MELINNYIKYFNIMPNLLIYGCSGSGKKMMLNSILNTIYKSTISNLSIKKFKLDDKDCCYYQNDNILLFKPYNSAIDKLIVNQIVDNFIIYDSDVLKTIIIYPFELLNYNAQASLRRISEIYYYKCKFICISYNIHYIMEPILSRFLLVKLSNYSINYLNYYLKFYYKIFDHQLIDNYIINSKYNLKLIDFMIKYPDSTINNLITELIKQYKSKNVKNIKFLSGEIYTKIYDYSNFFEVFLNKLIDENMLTFTMLQYFSLYNINLKKGNKEIFHIEALLISLLQHF